MPRICTIFACYALTILSSVTILGEAKKKSLSSLSSITFCLLPKRSCPARVTLCIRQTLEIQKSVRFIRPFFCAACRLLLLLLHQRTRLHKSDDTFTRELVVEALKMLKKWKQQQLSLVYRFGWCLICIKTVVFFLNSVLIDCQINGLFNF